MDLKGSIIALLKNNPKGLMAKEIAKKIPGASKKEINQILYGNSTVFVSINYMWFLRAETQCSKNVKGEQVSINRIETLSLARNIYYLRENERDELLNLSGATFKNITQNITLLKKATNFRRLTDFATFKKFLSLPEKEFCRAFYNAMVLGHGYEIRKLTDAQWLTFVLLPKQKFIIALNHAIDLNKVTALQNITFTLWFDFITMDDNAFTLKMATYRKPNISLQYFSSRVSYTSRSQQKQTLPSQNQGVVITRCTGICSNCNRDECIEVG